VLTLALSGQDAPKFNNCIYGYTDEILEHSASEIIKTETQGVPSQQHWNSNPRVGRQSLAAFLA
jgi:hypothetical protein